MLTLGGSFQCKGNITTLNWLLGPADHIEANIGYGAGRLALGYYLLLLQEIPAAYEFQLHGTTLRSGGREGKPAETKEADRLRPRVHDRIQAEYGESGYEALQTVALRGVTVKGRQRLAKVLPEIREPDDFSPRTFYPMGGGGLQWDLTEKKPFLVAMYVDRNNFVRTPGFVLDMNSGLPHEIYDKRARIARYLANA